MAVCWEVGWPQNAVDRVDRTWLSRWRLVRYSLKLLLGTGMMLFLSGTFIKPTPTAIAKYSAKGGFSKETFRRFGLSPELEETLISNASFSLSARTWTGYGTAERHLARVEKATGMKLDFPLSLQSTLAYIAYLLCPKAKGGRGLKGVSVEKYISALRMVHMQRGFFEPWIRPEIVKLCIRGAKHRDQIVKRLAGKAGKHAMTPQLMWKLKQQLNRAALTLQRKRIIWATATICFAGSLRIHELLARETRRFDPSSTMLASHIKLKRVELEGRRAEILQVFLAHPKEEKLSAGIKVDLFSSGDFMCPITAFVNWRRDKGVQLDAQMPLFRMECGRNYTGKLFNQDIKSLMGNIIDYNKTPITAHSFRRGLATFMAQQGYSDHDIMAVGRWKSEAFKAYIAAPRVVRGKLAATLALKVSKSVNFD